ncbi:two-component response regulator ARR14-like [Trifolium pratense]|uniref:two-component response regulator ARR14-like n=1 Tax=Trifolium pratense TaxID=57577 RepID=UPI001E697775|nr:two-component response regulator ARR14-like [Trifolium pratense]
MALSTEIDDLVHYQLQESLRVIVIDHDITRLHAIANMCIQYNYHVMTSTLASFALNLLRQTKGPFFDLILIDAQMPDMDTYDFLERVTQEIKIPVIIMGVDNTTSERMNGACDYWLKPLDPNDIKSMWLHVTRISHDQIQRDSEVVKTGQKRKKRDEESEKKMNRVSWRSSPELEEKFIGAVNHLGIDKATPKQIIELMDVRGLETSQVASHLQKFRLRRFNCSSKKAKPTSGRENLNVPRESIQVVESMAEHDKKSDNNFHAQQQHPIPMVFDDFEVSNILTNKTNMMLDDSSSLYEQGWYPFEDFGPYFD